MAIGFCGLRGFRQGEATHLGAQSGPHVATGPHGLRHLTVHLVPEERFRQGQAQPATPSRTPVRTSSCGAVPRVDPSNGSGPRIAW